MPGRSGRHGWRGGRGLQRGQIARVLEPCLLSLLVDGAGHGYDLVHALERFGLDPALLDSGLVYRSLRHMEEAGWLCSQWDTTGSGPARRVYTIIPEGRRALGSWKEELEHTHDILHRVLGREE